MAAYTMAAYTRDITKDDKTLEEQQVAVDRPPFGSAITTFDIPTWCARNPTVSLAQWQTTVLFGNNMPHLPPPDHLVHLGVPAGPDASMMLDHLSSRSSRPIRNAFTQLGLAATADYYIHAKLHHLQEHGATPAILASWQNTYAKTLEHTVDIIRDAITRWNDAKRYAPG